MAFDDTPNRLESCFIQRNDTNDFYEQINISGSNLIIYHSASGELTADKISVWAANYGIGGGGGVIPGHSYDITASYAASGSSTASFVGFDGNRSINRSGYTGLNVGGIDVVSFLNNFFFPFAPATVTISSGGTTYFENGTVQSFTIASTLTANDEVSYGTGSVKRNGITWQTIGAVSPGVITYIDPTISTNYTYQTFFQTNNNGSPTVISSNTKIASFIYPYLWGMSVTSGLSGTALYSAFTKQVVPQANKTVSLVGAVTYIYFCYPSTYPDLTSILDPNLFQVLSSFTKTTVSVTSVGLASNWTTNYTVYQTTLVSDPSGNFQFIY